MLQNYTKHDIYKLTVTLGDYNDEIRSYTKGDSVIMSIQIASHTEYNNNYYDLMSVTHLGVCGKYSNIEVGDKIDNIYEVKFIEPSRRFDVFYLSEVR